jgi:endonuclease-3
MISLRTKDEVTAAASARLLARASSPRALASLSERAIAGLIYPAGFYRTKARHLRQVGRLLAERGRVPEAMEDLLALPGVGRKTANLVRVFAMGQPGLIVETHFKRVIGRLGLTVATDPDKIEFELAGLLPQKEWTPFSNGLIWHGRRICVARKPPCEVCPLRPDCDYGRAMLNPGGVPKKK